MSNLQPDARHRHIASARSNRRDQPLLLVMLVLTLLFVMAAFQFTPTVDQNHLPSTKMLIRLAEAACKQKESLTGDKADWPLQVLANARAYSGDIEYAMYTALSLSEPWDAIAYAGSWKIHFELTESLAELPFVPDSSSDEPQISVLLARFDIAKTLTTAGRSEDARRFLPVDSKDRHTVSLFLDFHLAVAEAQIRRGDKIGAATNLEQASTYVDRLPLLLSYPRIRHMISIANHWYQMGDQDHAVRIGVGLEGEISDDNKDGEATSLMATDSARLGQFWAGIDDRERSAKAFREALRLAEAAYEQMKQKDYVSREMELNIHAETLGHIGALQFSSGWKTDAAAAYERAIALLTSEGDPSESVSALETNSAIGNSLVALLPKQSKGDSRDYQLLKLVKLQGDAGDFDGAARTISQMHGTYWKATGYGHCCKIAANAAAPALQELLAQAEVLGAAETKLGNRAEIFADIAESRAIAGDMAGAKRCFSAAIDASRMTSANDRHSWIARAQVRAGLFDDAFRVLGEISQHESRLLPLAELARAVAKKEALTRKAATAK